MHFSGRKDFLRIQGPDQNRLSNTDLDVLFSLRFDITSSVHPSIEITEIILTVGACVSSLTWPVLFVVK